MAGTIVADTIQDGAGNSTAMDNAIYGSAKAWVRFSGISSVTVNASYNVSSVTRNGTGDYSITFTNAFTDTNYVVTGTCQQATGNYGSCVNFPYTSAPTTSVARIVTAYYTAVSDSGYVSVAVFR